MEVGGWIVSEYRNIFDVVAILQDVAQKACAAVVYKKVSLQFVFFLFLMVVSDEWTMVCQIGRAHV